MMQSVRASLFYPNLTSMEPDARTATHRQDAQEAHLICQLAEAPAESPINNRRQQRVIIGLGYTGLI